MERLSIDKIRDTNICIHNINKLEYYNLKKSVQKYDQLRPIIINKNNEIIDGHKLYKVLKGLNYKEIWVKKIDTIKKEQIYCELNINKAEIDSIKFFRYVRDYIDIEDNCLNFTKQELKGFIKLLDFKWENFNKQEKKNFF